MPAGQREADFRLAAAEAIRAKGNTLFKEARLQLDCLLFGGLVARALLFIGRGHQRPGQRAVHGGAPAAGLSTDWRQVEGHCILGFTRVQQSAAWSWQQPFTLSASLQAALPRARSFERRGSTRRRCSATTRPCTGWTRTPLKPAGRRPARMTSSAWAMRSSRRCSTGACWHAGGLCSPISKSCAHCPAARQVLADKPRFCAWTLSCQSKPRQIL